MWKGELPAVFVKWYYYTNWLPDRIDAQRRQEGNATRFWLSSPLRLGVFA
jgi:hypothetical protein